MEGELSETLLSDLPVQQPLVEEKPGSKWSIKCDKSLWLNMLYISAFSYLGVMARKACEKLCEDQESGENVWQLPVIYQIFFGSTVFNGHGFFLANVVGCVVMGLMSKVQTLVTSSGTHGPYLYVGITTGFCGCLTTFATWNQNISQAASRSHAYNSQAEQEVPFDANMNTMHWFDAYFLLLVEFMLFYSSFILGQILGDGLYAILVMGKDSEADKAERAKIHQKASSMLQELHRESTLPAAAMARTSGWPAALLPETQIEGYIAAAVEATEQAASTAAKERYANAAPVGKENRTHIFVALGAFLGLSALSWLLAYLTSEGDWWKSTGRCMMFAPAGALLRYFFSLFNKNCGHVKVFTLIPNVLASAIDAVIFSRTTSVWWADFGTGFNGSLSTVSTFVNECTSLTHKWVLVYTGLSFGIAQLVCALINSFAPNCPSNEYYFGANHITAGSFYCHNTTNTTF